LRRLPIIDKIAGLRRGDWHSDALRQASREFLVRYGGDEFPDLFRSAKGTIVTSQRWTWRRSITPKSNDENQLRKS
jgi:hypothetical protein